MVSDDVLVDVPDDSPPYADAYAWRRLPARLIRKVMLYSGVPMISRQCNGLYDGYHGTHAWEVMNWSGKPYRRGRVTFLCLGDYWAKPVYNPKSILPQNLESSVRSHRG